ncbi:MAG: phosphoenolpyruvate--protein phosphotransferase [Candidatus Sumerlaeaceae bacterium]
MIPEEKILHGIPVAPGIAIGRAHVCAALGTIRTEQREIPVHEVETEVQRFLEAVEESKRQVTSLREQVAKELDAKHAEIYTPQLALLEDADLIDATVEAIRREQKNAEYLFARRMNEFLDQLRKLDDGFLSGRETDFQDVAWRVLSNLGRRQHATHATFGPDTVLVGHDLLPSQSASLLKDHVVGLALEKGGPTSHTAIIAKATEIPTVVGVEGIMQVVREGAPVIVDGVAGKVILFPSKETYDDYLQRQKEFVELERDLEELRDLPSETLDGYSVTLRANIEFPEEISHIALHGGKGIGLFRTEFIFLNRERLPSEEEQYQIYKQVAERVFPDTVVFRTLDVGGDKFFAASARPSELNPFMGLRAVRLCLKHQDIFRPQLRAMLRANTLGNAKILIPMISGVEEFREVKRLIYSVMNELRAEGVQTFTEVEIGAMVEIPSAAILADELARECDFFSIGTNDLIQYTLAVDRGNRSVAYLYEPLHLAVLRLLRTTVTAAEDAGIKVSVCGEAAADPLYALVLAGMGVHELSMSAVNIPAVKRVIRAVTLKEVRTLVEDVFNAPSIDERKRVLRAFLDFLVRERSVPAGEILTTSIAHLE